MKDEFSRRRLRLAVSSFILHPSSLVIALIVLLATSAQALEIPPPPAQWCNDAAGLLTQSQAQELNETLRSFEQQSGAQFIIYVFPSLEGESIEDFTIRCAERWKVGNKKYDNGLILFVFVKERKVRIEVGYGLEPTITDAFSSRVIREQIAPHFQQGDYFGGLKAAADALIAKIRGSEAPVPPAQGARRPSSGVSGIDPFFLIIIAAIFFLFILPMLRGRRRGGCGGCFWPMLFFPGGGTTFGRRGGGFGGGFGGGGFGGGGFSGGGGSFGGGGATGGW